MSELVSFLAKTGVLKTPIIIEAFEKIKRIDFLPIELKGFSEIDEALPIGFNQTISQPSVVAFMLELLEPAPGEKVLDIGSGSGWTTALLAYIVSQENKKGRVIAIEIIPQLKEFGKNNVSKYNFIEKGVVKFICADGSKGYEKEAPFDKILCSAEIQGEEKIREKEEIIKIIPEKWKEQLKIGGKIVTPINNSIFLISKLDKEKYNIKEFPGFVFVPLVQKNEK